MLGKYFIHLVLFGLKWGRYFPTGFGDQTASHLPGFHSGGCEGSRTVFFLTVAHHSLGHRNYFCDARTLGNWGTDTDCCATLTFKSARWGLKRGLIILVQDLRGRPEAFWARVLFDLSGSHHTWWDAAGVLTSPASERPGKRLLSAGIFLVGQLPRQAYTGKDSVEGSDTCLPTSFDILIVRGHWRKPWDPLGL